MKVFKVLGQSERDALKLQHVNHYLYRTHIAIVLGIPYCYQMSLFARDFSNIWIHSCLPNAARYPYQLLSEAIAYIRNHQDFLGTTCPGCLDGVKVKEYRDRLISCEIKLQTFFVSLGDCFLLDKGSIVDGPQNEVTDGMHRLVAYGLASSMNAMHFPIPVYLGTELPPDQIDPS